ncbi:MAG: ABC transporter permease [Deltaproteobacteria bacterium]|jgi:phospholipid/cholesterol/gamma-HCH transport system permease protein|nr:ABC transporter permease [Deltaproteobacteria bacterium]
MGSPITAPKRIFPEEKVDFFESIGRWVRGKVMVFLNLSTLLYMAFRELITERKKGFSLVFEITLRQVYFTAVQALKVVAVISLALGTVIIVQIGTQLSFLGGGIEFIVPILVLVLFRELGPLLTAIIVIGRSGTAIATELGNIVIAHELEAIEVMGINPVYFIVTPRIIGVTVAVICLTIIFITVGLLGGFWVSKLILPITFQAFLRELGVALTAHDLIFAFLKSLIFGLLIALTCTYYGLTVGYSLIEVPQAATRGVVSAMLFCFATNALLTVLFYL